MTTQVALAVRDRRQSGRRPWTVLARRARDVQHDTFTGRGCIRGLKPSVDLLARAVLAHRPGRFLLTHRVSGRILLVDVDLTSSLILVMHSLCVQACVSTAGYSK